MFRLWVRWSLTDYKDKEIIIIINFIICNHIKIDYKIGILEIVIVQIIMVQVFINHLDLSIIKLNMEMDLDYKVVQ